MNWLIYTKKNMKYSNAKMLFISFICVIMIMGGIVSAGVILADNVDINSSTISSSSTVASSSSNVMSSNSPSLSSSDIDKIISEISSGASSENFEKTMDELIQRAILMGDANLQQYAEYMKQKYTLSDQQAVIDGNIAALAAKYPSIAELDKKMSEVSKSGVSVETVQEALPTLAVELLEGIDMASNEGMQEVLVELGNIMDVSNSSALSDEDKNLMSFLLCQEAIDQELFKDAELASIESCRDTALSNLLNTEKSKYTSSEYEKLSNLSKTFSLSYKNAKSAGAEQIIMYNQSFKLKNPAINYCDTLLISVDDAFQFIDATYSKTEGNSTITIMSPGVRLEVSAGVDKANVNDKSKSMGCAMLNVNGANYIPVEFFAQTYGISYSYSADKGVIVMYNNLNQLSNVSVANTLKEVK